MVWLRALVLKTIWFKRLPSSAAYNINYHFVWRPKYCKKILVSEIASFVELQIWQLASERGYEVIEMYVMPDHIHLLVRCNLFESPVNIVKGFKAITAIRMFKQFPELRRKLWKGVLWSPSYYVATTGHVFCRNNSQIHPRTGRQRFVHG